MGPSSPVAARLLLVTMVAGYCGAGKRGWGIRQIKMSQSSLSLPRFSYFSWINVPRIATSLCSILRVLIKLTLVSFAIVFVAFVDDRISEGPCSTIFTDVLLACYCRFHFILLYILSTSVSEPCPSLMLELFLRKQKCMNTCIQVHSWLSK